VGEVGWGKWDEGDGMGKWSGYAWRRWDGRGEMGKVGYRKGKWERGRQVGLGTR